jgi:hypothetical protein
MRVGGKKGSMQFKAFMKHQINRKGVRVEWEDWHISMRNDGEEGRGLRIFTCWNEGVVPTISKDRLQICWWIGVHTPIAVDLEAL